MQIAHADFPFMQNFTESKCSYQFETIELLRKMQAYNNCTNKDALSIYKMSLNNYYI